MGEQADYAIQDGMDDLGHGQDDMLNGANPEPPPHSLKNCRCCGAGFLHWKLFDGKWRLANTDLNGTMHNCPVRPVDAP